VGGLALSPATTDVATASAWLSGAGGAVDGVIAKRLDLAYRSGDRTGMEKIKRARTADCVVGDSAMRPGRAWWDRSCWGSMTRRASFITWASPRALPPRSARRCSSGCAR
jgi:hypothetical protein